MYLTSKSHLQVKHAEENRALGVILYPDPLDFANNCTNVYPNTWWMPDWAVPTHHVRYNLVGDPQTPDYPSVGKLCVVDARLGRAHTPRSI